MKVYFVSNRYWRIVHVDKNKNDERELWSFQSRGNLDLRFFLLPFRLLREYFALHRTIISQHTINDVIARDECTRGKA